MYSSALPLVMGRIDGGFGTHIYLPSLSECIGNGLEGGGLQPRDFFMVYCHARAVRKVIFSRKVSVVLALLK